MSTIILAKEGVFPITKDAEGRSLPQLPATGLAISGTIQGEGMLAGIPSLFIRLSGCNLQCMWSLNNGELSICDTSYASFNARETIKIDIADVVMLVKHNLGNMRHIVISGGEPMLQKKSLAQLCAQLKEIDNLHITLETNGTIFDADVARHIDLFSISPKLSNSNPNLEKQSGAGVQTQKSLFDHHNKTRVNIEALQQLLSFTHQNNKSVQLKFVVGRPNDATEIMEIFLNRLTHWNNDQVMIMPLGATPQQLKISIPIALEAAISNNWRIASRIHIDLFGAKTGT